MYWEDADYSMRAKKAGLKAYYYPHAHIWHKNAGSSDVGSSLQEYFMTRNRLWFGMEYAPFRTKFALLREAFRRYRSTETAKWVKLGIRDWFKRRMGKGSWEA
jgi:GT2 family glycosyltransferase